jgi:hypothetical protein
MWVQTGQCLEVHIALAKIIGIKGAKSLHIKDCQKKCQESHAMTYFEQLEKFLKAKTQQNCHAKISEKRAKAKSG